MNYRVFVIRFCSRIGLGLVIATLSILATVACAGCGSTQRHDQISRTINVVTDPACVVPSVVGESLSVARKALDKAHCNLGNVTGPGKQPVLYIVTAQSVRVGTRLPEASAVDVQAGAAPRGLVSYRVPSGAMEPSVPVGTVVWLQTKGYSPVVGDVVLLHPPSGAEREECGPAPHMIEPGGAACSEPVRHESIIKVIRRIVAGPGDIVSIVGGNVIRNGKRELDPYSRSCGSSPVCDFPTPIKIPPSHWFMLGDDRGESVDSRYWGPVPTNWIIGHVVYCTAIGRRCP